MAFFSQRKGFKPIRDTVQLESMDETLKNAIWNCFHDHIIHKPDFMDNEQYRVFGEIHKFADLFWGDFLKEAIDMRPQGQDQIYVELRHMYFRFEWHEVYSFVEFVVWCVRGANDFEIAINKALEIEMAGYRLAHGKIVEITNTTELNAVDDALSQSDFPEAGKHLKRALELISDKRKPDARNSIKESISAVESAAQVLTGNPKATLGEALKIADKKQQIHSALKDAFLKLYGYTNDHGGIRHAMTDSSELTKADALFFLVSCSAFINYLKSKI